MDFFLKYKIVILRSLGAIMLIVGFAVHFWVTPQKGLSANEKAAARIAKMEASAKGSNTHQSKVTSSERSKFLEALKEKQEQQMQYMTIIAMVFGIGFLIYSFIPKKDA